MSTALLDQTADRVQEPRELVLDAVTHQRLKVAACAVDTLEELADTGSWERLDPALAQHLVDHVQRLGSFLERVRHLPAVRACEQEMLAVRRVERRLEVALDLLVEEEPTARSGRSTKARKGGPRKLDEHFLGDFSEKTLTDEQRQLARERRRKRKEGKALLTPRGKRILLYVSACLVLTVASVALVALGGLSGSDASTAVGPAEEPMKSNEYLEDVRVFLPAKKVIVHDNTAVVMVRREWLLKSPQERQVDADGAHVFLSNRAITALDLLWEDGGLIARAEKDGNAVFAEGTSGLIRFETEPAAATPPGLEPAAPPGLAGDAAAQ